MSSGSKYSMGFSNYALMTGRYSVSFLRKILWPVEEKLKGLHKIQPKWEVKLRGAHLFTGASGLLAAGESLSSAGSMRNLVWLSLANALSHPSLASSRLVLK